VQHDFIAISCEFRLSLELEETRNQTVLGKIVTLLTSHQIVKFLFVLKMIFPGTQFPAHGTSYGDGHFQFLASGTIKAALSMGQMMTSHT
jgi:hypothetical protein